MLVSVNDNSLFIGQGRVSPNVFIHFLDVYHTGRALRAAGSLDKVLREATQAFRMAFMFGETLYLPASSLFESEIARRVLRGHDAIVDYAPLIVTAGDESLEAHHDSKAKQYDERSPDELSKAYTGVLIREAPPYRQLLGSSTELIRKTWLNCAENTKLTGQIFVGVPGIETVWRRIPNDLERLAFVPDHVNSIFERHGYSVPKSLLNRVIESAYLKGYADRLKATLVVDLAFLQSPFPLRTKRGDLFYYKLRRSLQMCSLDHTLFGRTPEQLVKLRYTPEWKHLSFLLRTSPVQADTIALARSFVAQVGRWTGPAERRTFLPTTYAPPAKAYRGRAMINVRSAARAAVSVAIITALPVECAAMQQLLGECVEEAMPPGFPDCFVGSVKGLDTNSQMPVLLVQLPRPGTNSAAVVTALIRAEFPHVQLFVMVGIAGGVPSPGNPSKHVRLGDVVVSDRKGIVQFDHGAHTDGVLVHREAMPPPSAEFTKVLNRIDRDELNRPGDEEPEWIRLCRTKFLSFPRFSRPPEEPDDYLDAGALVPHPVDPDRVPGRPRRFRANIASSNGLIRDPAKRDEIARKHDVLAFEMEGAGVAEAAWEFGQYYAVVRGISDYGNEVRSEVWHGYASAVAASFAYHVLRVYADVCYATRNLEKAI